jgi:hypothetical protein
VVDEDDFDDMEEHIEESQSGGYEFEEYQVVRDEADYVIEEDEIVEIVDITDSLEKQPDNSAQSTLVAVPPKKEEFRVVDDGRTFQRYGPRPRSVHKQMYKCHLCGFATGLKESLFKHFADRHPN